VLPIIPRTRYPLGRHENHHSRKYPGGFVGAVTVCPRNPFRSEIVCRSNRVDRRAAPEMGERDQVMN